MILRAYDGDWLAPGSASWSDYYIRVALLVRRLWRRVAWCESSTVARFATGSRAWDVSCRGALTSKSNLATYTRRLDSFGPSRAAARRL